MTEEKDVYWEAVSPEIKEYLDNQIFLLKHKKYWNPIINKMAINEANMLLLPSLEDEETGTLTAKASGRHIVKKLVNNPEFQDIITRNDDIPNLIWTPMRDRVYKATLYAWKQERILRACQKEKVRRLKEDEIAKNTFWALLQEDKFHAERKAAMKFLRRLSLTINDQIGEDLLQDWLTELWEMPFPTQSQSLQLTKIVIQRDGIDDSRGTVEISLDEVDDEGRPQREKLELQFEVLRTAFDGIDDEKAEEDFIKEIGTELGERPAEIAEVFLEFRREGRVSESDRVFYQDVAKRLGIAPKTVSRHIKKIQQFLS